MFCLISDRSKSDGVSCIHSSKKQNSTDRRFKYRERHGWGCLIWISYLTSDESYSKCSFIILSWMIQMAVRNSYKFKNRLWPQSLFDNAIVYVYNYKQKKKMCARVQITAWKDLGKISVWKGLRRQVIIDNFDNWLVVSRSGCNTNSPKNSPFYLWIEKKKWLQLHNISNWNTTFFFYFINIYYMFLVLSQWKNSLSQLHTYFACVYVCFSSFNL